MRAWRRGWQRTVAPRVLRPRPDAFLLDRQQRRHRLIGHIVLVEHTAASGDEGTAAGVGPRANRADSRLGDLRVDNEESGVVVEVAFDTIVLGDDVRGQAHVLEHDVQGALGRALRGDRG